MEPDPDTFKQWTPSAVLAFWTAITMTIGAAAVWMSKHGFALYVKISDYRFKNRERKAAFDKKKADEARRPFSPTQIFEDKDIEAGYRAWMWDTQQQLSSMKQSMTEMDTHYRACIEERAKAKSDAEAALKRAERAESDSNESRRMIRKLERQVNRLQQELHIDPDKDNGNPEDSHA